METIQKRQKLHEYIDIADDEKVNALFLILNSDDVNAGYSAENIQIFYERSLRYLKTEGKNYSVEEAFEQIRKNK